MLRDELSTKNFKLSYKLSRHFVESELFPVPVLLVYRSFVAVFCSCWVVYNTVTSPVDEKAFFYLTNWMYACLTGYFILSSSITILQYAEGRQKRHHQRLVNQDELSDENGDNIHNDERMRWYYRAAWLLYNISSNLSFCVTILFWTLIYDGKIIHTSDIFVHILNSVFMILENVLSSVPLRLLHFIYPLILSLVYTLMTLLFWLLIDKSPIYPVLDYSHRPGVAAGVLCGSMFILLPIVQIFLYALYRLRNYLASKNSERLDY